MQTPQHMPAAGGPSLSRRGFIKAGLAAAGGLLLSVELPLSRTLAGDREAATALSAWLRIAADGRITVTVPSAEMGQGVTTALPMLVAEELEADWSLVEVAFAPVDEAYVNPRLHTQGTFGSNSVRGFFEPLRRAGATAREMLRQAAAQRWEVPLDECSAAEGRIHHVGGRSEGYGTLVEAAARLPPPSEVALKPRREWRRIGVATPRLDTPAKVAGTLRYGVDVQLPDMLVASVIQCPVFGGRLVAVDEAPALAVRGVTAVVRLDDAVAVVAEGYWPARKGLLALRPEWDEGDNGSVDEATIAARLAAGLEAGGAVAEREGDVAAALAGASRTLTAEYRLPFLAHTTMEPMTATARVTAGGCEVWAPTQAPQRARQIVADRLGLTPERVTLHTPYLGGGFGRRAEHDFVIQAVTIAREIGRPVKLIWSREEDIQHDFYRPAALARLRAGLDARGRLTAFEATLCSPSIMARVFPPAVEDGVDPTSVEGLVESPYALGARRIAYAHVELGIPVGFWRSVGNSITGFLMESFIDELAHAAGQDPLAFRLGLLAERPRHRAVLERVAAMAGWGEPLPEGHHRGLALHESMGSIVAEVVELSLVDDRLRVHRVDCAVDCGIAVNPDSLVAQMEGGIVYGLSAALFGEITLDGGRVVQDNFTAYRLLRLAQMPEIRVAIIEGGDAPGGAGEPSTPPITPALVNALFAATGRRTRSLPLSRHGIDVG